MTKTTTAAGTAGRIVGTACRHLIAIERQIDWAEVQAIVIDGIKVLIVLTLLAGRATRRLWDAVPNISERLGRWYAARIVRAAVAPCSPPPAAAVHPLLTMAEELEQLTVKQLREVTGCRRKLAKWQLIAMAVAC